MRVLALKSSIPGQAWQRIPGYSISATASAARLRLVSSLARGARAVNILLRAPGDDSHD